MLKIKFSPRWREELVATCDEGVLIFEFTMGKNHVYFFCCLLSFHQYLINLNTIHVYYFQFKSFPIYFLPYTWNVIEQVQD